MKNGSSGCCAEETPGNFKMDWISLLWRNPCRELRRRSWGLFALRAFCPRRPGIPPIAITSEGQRELR
jgi:hypothetical protein